MTRGTLKLKVNGYYLNKSRELYEFENFEYVKNFKPTAFLYYLTQAKENKANIRGLEVHDDCGTLEI